MEGLNCFVCLKKSAKPCEKCGFIWYCGDVCQKHDYDQHNLICQLERKYVDKGPFYAGTAAVMMVYQKRATDTIYEAETKLCETFSETLQSPDALVAALGTCTEPNEYVRLDVANFVKWLIHHIDPDREIRKRIDEANKKKLKTI
jgi:hypothetical protein